MIAFPFIQARLALRNISLIIDVLFLFTFNSNDPSRFNKYNQRHIRNIRSVTFSCN